MRWLIACLSLTLSNKWILVIAGCSTSARARANTPSLMDNHDLTKVPCHCTEHTLGLQHANAKWHSPLVA